MMTRNNNQLIDDTTIERFIDATINEQTFAIVDVVTSFAFNATTTHNDEHDTLCNMLISTL